MKTHRIALFATVLMTSCGTIDVKHSGLDKPTQNLKEGMENFDPLRQESIRKDQQQIAALKAENEKLRQKGATSTGAPANPRSYKLIFRDHFNGGTKSFGVLRHIIC